MPRHAKVMWSIALLACVVLVLCALPSSSKSQFRATGGAQGAAYVKALGGHLVEAESGRGVMPNVARYSVRCHGGTGASDPTEFSVDRDGRFRLEDFPSETVEVLLEFVVGEPYVRLPLLVFRHNAATMALDSMVGPLVPVFEPGLDLRIQVTGGGSLTGRVSRAPEGLSRTAAVVAVWEPADRLDPGVAPFGQLSDGTGFRVAQLPLARECRVWLAGLHKEGLLSDYAQARVGGLGPDLTLALAESITGRMLGATDATVIHAVDRQFLDASGGMGSLGRGFRPGRDGRFKLEGLARALHELVILRGDSAVDAIAVRVEAGAADITVRPQPRGFLRGRVLGLAPDAEAFVELWWPRGCIPLLGKRTSGGEFAFEVPLGERYSVLVRSEEVVPEVALQEDLAPGTGLVTISLKRGLELSAHVRDARGPVYAMASAGGICFHAWIPTGGRMHVDGVPAGAYRVQLLSFAQAHTWFGMSNRTLLPRVESWQTPQTVVAGDAAAVIGGP